MRVCGFVIVVEECVDLSRTVCSGEREDILKKEKKKKKKKKENNKKNNNKESLVE